MQPPTGMTKGLRSAGLVFSLKLYLPPQSLFSVSDQMLYSIIYRMEWNCQGLGMCKSCSKPLSGGKRLGCSRTTASALQGDCDECYVKTPPRTRRGVLQCLILPDSGYRRPWPRPPVWSRPRPRRPFLHPGPRRRRRKCRDGWCGPPRRRSEDPAGWPPGPGWC